MQLYIANLGGLLGFLNAGFDEVGVVPAAELIVSVPRTLSMSQHSNLVRRHRTLAVYTSATPRLCYYDVYGDFCRCIVQASFAESGDCLVVRKRSRLQGLLSLPAIRHLYVCGLAVVPRNTEITPPRMQALSLLA